MSFKNLELTGQPGAYRVQLAGADAEHSVRDVRFENVSVLGSLLKEDSSPVSIGANVEGVRFVK